MATASSMVPGSYTAATAYHAGNPGESNVLNIAGIESCQMRDFNDVIIFLTTGKRYGSIPTDANQAQGEFEAN